MLGVETAHSHLNEIDRLFRLVLPEDLRNVGNLLSQQGQLLFPTPFFLVDAGFFATGLEPRLTLTRRFGYDISKAVLCTVTAQGAMECRFKGRET